VIDFTFEEFDIEHLCAGARVTNPLSRNILEKCGFQWLGVELHRFEALGSSTPVDRFKLSRGVWASLKNWGSSTKRVRLFRHCVERSDEAIQSFRACGLWIASRSLSSGGASRRPVGSQ
jgi:hypothetical protein